MVTAVPPNPSGEQLAECFSQLHTPNYCPHPINIVSGSGSAVYDETGKEYIDLAGGIAVSALGHQHPKLLAAAKESVNSIWHLSNFWTNQPAMQLAEALCTATFAERVFFANSGAEANEAALKLARKYAHDNFGEHKNRILACNQSFHGRTLFTTAVTGKGKFNTAFAPLPPAIDHIEYNNTKDLAQTLNDDYCALIVELVQGEGGVIPASDDFIQQARKLCDQHKVLLIFDEVQTGMGRTGSLYAYQRFGVTPDILTSAKALGCGLPIGAMLTTQNIASYLEIGSHGSTAGGNPFVARVALAGLNTINQQTLLDQVVESGKQARAQLEKINLSLKCFSEVRSAGLLIGCVLNPDLQDRADAIVDAAIQQGVLILTAAGGKVLRLTPALNIPRQQLEQGISRLKQAIRSVSGE